MDKIFVSLAAYRDPDLINTVRSIYTKATHKDRLFFSLVSHEGEECNFDFSFIPKHQLSYQKIDYRLADGACSGRHLANSLLSKQYKYFLHTDSHSRVADGWDETLIDTYNRLSCVWGDLLILTKYPHGFTFDWDNGGVEKFSTDEDFYKAGPIWREAEQLYLLEWEPLEDKVNGDKAYAFCANFAFGSSEAFMRAPYDPYIYFLGEEISLGIRLILNGVTLIAPPVNVLWTNFDRDNGRINFHWIDNQLWGVRDAQSRVRLAQLFRGEDLGVYGIQDHMEGFAKLQKEMGLNFDDKDFVKNVYK